MSAVVVTAVDEKFDTQVPLIIVGAGAAGLCAALAAKEAGIDAVVVERDDLPSGSTALSAGLIPAAGTRFQRDKGIADSPDLFAADIQRKAKGEADRAVVETVAAGAAPLVEWLADRYGLPFDVIDNFNYPGHSAMRMHGLPSRTGRELIDRLRSAAEANDIVILAKSTAQRLFADSESRVRGVEVARRDGSCERIGCGTMILACNGFGGNPELVRRYIPEMAGALYFGHPGQQGRCRHLGRCAWRSTFPSWRLSGSRLGRDAAQHPDHLGNDHAGRHSGQRRRPALLRRDAWLLRAGGRSPAAAGWNCLDRVRCAHCRSGAAVRRFPKG